MFKNGCFIILAVLFIAAPATAAEFTLSFEWGDIPLCTTGRPNVIPNPRFVLSGVPEGTRFLQFKLTDLDVPSYDHGGGTVEYAGRDTIEPGAFKYKSPCPPSGSHRYRWTVTAREKTGFFSGSLGKAQMTRNYP
jgi:phosphatidylethanolamine-binding protein (PEBP) family uncharacterized protein